MGDNQIVYKNTVLFKNDDFLGAAYAMSLINDKTQVVPLADNLDYSGIINQLKGKTTTLVIFGTFLTKDDVSAYLTNEDTNKTVDSIKIYVESTSSAMKYSSGNNYPSDIGEIVPFDSKITLFNSNNLREVLYLDGSLIVTWVLDIILLAINPSYKPSINNKEVSVEYGKYFINGLALQDDNLQTLSNIYNNIKGFEILHDIIIAGRSIIKYRKRTAAVRIKMGIECTIDDTKYLCIYESDQYIITEISKMVSKVDYYVIYFYYMDKVYFNIICFNERTPSMLLNKFDSIKHTGKDSVLVSDFETAKKILQFIEPQPHPQPQPQPQPQSQTETTIESTSGPKIDT